MRRVEQRGPERGSHRGAERGPERGCGARRRRGPVQRERVVYLDELVHVVLLEAQEAGQRGRGAARARQAVHHVAPLVLAHQQRVPHFALARAAVVRGLAARAAVEAHGHVARAHHRQRARHAAQRLHHARAHGVVQPRVRHSDVPRQIPRQVDHGHDGLEVLHLVPLVPFEGEAVLATGERPDVPRDVVAPARRLHPMNATRVHPHHVAGALSEAVDRNAVSAQLLGVGPPRAVKIRQTVSFAEFPHAAPVRVRNAEPLAVARSDVDIYGAKVIILLVTGRTTTGDLHIQLNCVHSQDHVPDVR